MSRHGAEDDQGDAVVNHPWTPGPWRVEQGTLLVWGACDSDDSSSYGTGYPVCVGCHAAGWAKHEKPLTEEQEANAHLIAAAPEMAELLEKMAADIRETADTSYQLEDGSIHPAEQHHYDQAVALAVEAETLLARIRGEQS